MNAVATLPINHLKRTLDRCCGQWEFDGQPSERLFVVRFLNTGKLYRVIYSEVHQDWITHVHNGSVWTPDSFLTDRLNGLTRTDSGDSLPADFACVPGVE